MKTKILAFFLISIVLSIPCLAEDLNAKLTIVSREKNSGNLRWQSTVEGQIFKEEDKRILFLQENGAENSDKEWVATGYAFVTNGLSTIVPYQIKVDIKDTSGTTLESVFKFFDAENQKVYVTKNGKNFEFEYRENMVDKLLSAISFMTFPFEEEESIKINFLTHEPAFYSADLKYRGKETITVRGQQVECYKLEIVFDLGLLNLVQFFIPKFYVWHEVQYPHFLARYEGLEGGLGTPYVVVEVTSLESGVGD